MGKQYIVLMLFSLAIIAHANQIATKNWFQNIQHAKEKVSYLQFYVQDILSGPSPTLVGVASATSTSTSPTFFGNVVVLDDPIRIRPDPSSDIVGRAQGSFVFASLEDVSIHMSFDLVFTSGEYNGSVLSLIGHNPYLQNYRELSIAGGSGVFRLARGVVGVRTVSLNSATGDAFFEYNITVLHY